MIPKRIIARLDIKGPDVVKGFQLEGVKRVGFPDLLARKYYNENIDEIIYIDSVASLYGRNNIFSVVEKAANEIFIPLTVGGGIRSINDFSLALSSGADKVAINTAACHNPKLVENAAKTFGSQCVVCSVQAMKHGNDLEWEALTDNARERTGKNVIDWVKQLESLGAGEILLTSVKNEGCKNGFDIELYKEVNDKVKIPVIAHGGAGNSEHIIELFKEINVDAVALASVLHHDILSIQYIKEALSNEGFLVRI